MTSMKNWESFQIDEWIWLISSPFFKLHRLISPTGILLPSSQNGHEDCTFPACSAHGRQLTHTDFFSHLSLPVFIPPVPCCINCQVTFAKCFFLHSHGANGVWPWADESGDLFCRVALKTVCKSGWVVFTVQLTRCITRPFQTTQWIINPN